MARKRKRYERNKFGVSALEAAKALDLPRELVYEIARRKESREIRLPDEGSHPRWRRFESVEVLREWIATRWPAAFLGTVERGGRRLGGLWAAFAREGWAGYSCEKHRAPLVLARIVGLYGDAVVRVQIRCGVCLAGLARVPTSFVPSAQRRLLPNEPGAIPNPDLPPVVAPG